VGIVIGESNDYFVTVTEAKISSVSSLTVTEALKVVPVSSLPLLNNSGAVVTVL
jgi:hypothetical protein